VLRDAVPKYRAAYTPDRIIVASNGEVWVRRASPTPGARTEWIVVSKVRGIVRRAVFANRTSVLAVTHDKVFVLRYDEADLQYMEMHKLR
jgi:exosome complex RNA-binding protein Rrp4